MLLAPVIYQRVLIINGYNYSTCWVVVARLIDYLIHYRPAHKKHLRVFEVSFSGSYLLVQNQATFPTSGFLSAEGFESRSFCMYTSNESIFSYVRIGGGYSERVPPASNAPRCWMLAAETKIAASSHQQPPT